MTLKFSRPKFDRRKVILFAAYAGIAWFLHGRVDLGTKLLISMVIVAIFAATELYARAKTSLWLSADDPLSYAVVLAYLAKELVWSLPGSLEGYAPRSDIIHILLDVFGVMIVVLFLFKRSDMPIFREE